MTFVTISVAWTSRLPGSGRGPVRLSGTEKQHKPRFYCKLRIGTYEVRAFDYRSGEAVRPPPCVNLQTYPAAVIDGDIRIEIG